MERVDVRQSQLTCLDTFYERGVGCISSAIKTIFCKSRIGGIFIEFVCAPLTFFKSIYHYLKGRIPLEKFHVNDLNPVELGSLKPHSVAIIYIHGCMANIGTWIPLSKKMKEEGVGPGFTLDLNGKALPWNYDDSSNRYCEDINVVKDKLDELKAKYEKEGLQAPKFIIVGHSRGGAIGHEIADRYDVKRVISLGEGRLWHHDKVYDIEGKYDALVPPCSQQAATHRSVLRATHLGLLYDKSVHQKVVELCRETIDL